MFKPKEETMGTNFYMMTKSKQVADEWFGYDRELIDEPDWGYSIHIAKTSVGWRPLFQAHEKIRSVGDLKLIYETGEFIIYDEYNEVYTWDEFEKRVVDWNKDNPDACGHVKPDRFKPNFYKMYGYNYSDSRNFLSADGYDFTNGEFS